MSSKEIIKMLEKDGWILRKIVGSHHHFKHPSKKGKVTVPHPNKDLTEGMADNAINGAVLGAVFGSAMGGLDTHTDRIAFNNQKRTLLNHINTGNDAVDSQLRNYVDMLNHGATELGDLVSASRVQALNNAGIATAKARQVAEEALAEQQAKAKFESDFFDEEQPQQQNLFLSGADLFAEA